MKLTQKALAEAARAALVLLNEHERPNLFADSARHRLYERAWSSLSTVAKRDARVLPPAARVPRMRLDLLNAAECAIELGWADVVARLEAFLPVGLEAKKELMGAVSAAVYGGGQ